VVTPPCLPGGVRAGELTQPFLPFATLVATSWLLRSRPRQNYISKHRIDATRNWKKWLVKARSRQSVGGGVFYHCYRALSRNEDLTMSRWHSVAIRGTAFRWRGRRPSSHLRSIRALTSPTAFSLLRKIYRGGANRGVTGRLKTQTLAA